MDHCTLVDHCSYSEAVALHLVVDNLSSAVAVVA